MASRQLYTLQCQASDSNEGKMDKDLSNTNEKKMKAVDAIKRTYQEAGSNFPGKGPKSSNLIMGSHTGEKDFKEVDARVNTYPDVRYFTAIGTGGAEFTKSMKEAAEGVLGSIHEECVIETPSRNGKYVSVRVGPVTVHSSDQVIAVYSAMREDPRLKLYL